MFITIINDCRDDNAAGRQATRTASLLGFSPAFIGVQSDLEAAGNLVDALDAGEGQEGVVLVNVAPRHGKAKKWENGSPFGYFFYRKTLVVTSVDRFTLSLVKKLKIIDTLHVIDLPQALEKMVGKEKLSKTSQSHIAQTQFRSYDFLPRAAKWLLEGEKLPRRPWSINQIPDAPKAVWHVDNFGNCKTTLLAEDVAFRVGKDIQLQAGVLPTFSRLKDVPDGARGLVIGSSGIKNKRFLEIVVQGGSAAEYFRLSSGSVIM